MSNESQVSSIEEIYRTCPETEKDVEHLKDWLTKQNHLPSVTDLQLVTFLKSSDNSLEAAKLQIDSYFTIKNGSPEFFSNRDPLLSDFKHLSKVANMSPMKEYSPEGYRYVFLRLVDSDPSKFDPIISTKLFFMIVDAWFKEDPLIPGIVVIGDMTNFTLSHVIKVNITSLKKMLMYVQFAMPVKLRAMHVINVTPIIHSIMAFLKPFLSEELIQMLHFHPGPEGMAKFHESVAKKIVPKDYGGEGDTVLELFENALKNVANNRQWLMEDEEKCKVDETKREGKIRHGDDLFGQQGSFKKLSID